MFSCFSQTICRIFQLVGHPFDNRKMADETNEDDSWLYGNSNPEGKPELDESKEANGEQEYDEDPQPAAVNESQDEFDGDVKNEVCLRVGLD